MEGKRMATGSSSSSLVSDLFGRKDYSSTKSSSGIFGSVFPPPSSVTRSHNSNPTKTTASAVLGKSKSRGNNSSQSSVSNSKFHGGNKTDHHPCYLSSSVYYGGQDYYCSHPNLGTNKKDAERPSDPIDSRGDWWQGSLYY